MKMLLYGLGVFYVGGSGSSFEITEENKDIKMRMKQAVSQESETPEELFVQTSGWTPVFGDADIERTLSIPGTDSDYADQYWREGEGADEWNPDKGLQFIAAPETTFMILSTPSELVYEVECITCDYENAEGFSLFIAPTDFTQTEEVPTSDVSELPPTQTIITRIEEMKNAEVNYGWGGNAPIGTEYNLDPILGKIENYGVDCSGILYYATDQFTPRNTSDFLTFGKSVDIKGKSAEEISKTLKPLDVIVWKGHMMIVMEDGRLIESRFASLESGEPSGVIERDLVEALRETMRSKTPLNDYSTLSKGQNGFVVRRFVQ